MSHVTIFSPTTDLQPSFPVNGYLDLRGRLLEAKLYGGPAPGDPVVPASCTLVDYSEEWTVFFNIAKKDVPKTAWLELVFRLESGDRLIPPLTALTFSRCLSALEGGQKDLGTIDIYYPNQNLPQPTESMRSMTISGSAGVLNPKVDQGNTLVFDQTNGQQLAVSQIPCDPETGNWVLHIDSPTNIDDILQIRVAFTGCEPKQGKPATVVA